MVIDNTRAGFSFRLNQALDEAGLPPKHHGRQVEAAKLFGVSQNAVRKWLEGEVIPELDRLPEIVKKINSLVPREKPVSELWLAFGRGTMRGEPSVRLTVEEEQVLQIMRSLRGSPLSDEEETVLSFFRSSDNSVRDLILNMALAKQTAGRGALATLADPGLRQNNNRRVVNSDETNSSFKRSTAR